MTTRVSLDGDWRLAFFPQPASGPVRGLSSVPACGTVAAEVPGCCELDLARAGLLPPPEKGLAALEWRRFEGHQWLYSREFDAPAVPEGGRAVLRFDGIDTLADIFLNGEKIGETANMLVPHEFDVTRRLKPGANAVQVLIRSAFLEAQADTAALYGFQEGTADRARVRKAAHMGGWDIFPRLYVSGLWRPAALVVEGPVRIREAFWVTGDYGRGPDGARRCRVRSYFKVVAPAPRYFAGASELRLSIRPAGGGAAVAEDRRPLETVSTCVELSASGFDLWWPAGAGGQPLYDAAVEVVDPATGELLARDVRRIGFRTVELERDDDFGPDRPGKFLFRVNGEPIYVRGANWVPTDAIPCRQAARIGETLALAEEANCNLVRVWGGGVYEPDSFYDRCDERGILVWQDFMTGCAQTPQDDAYAAATDAEVRSVALRLRNHPCLALWAGNNENDESIEWRRMRGVASIGQNGDRTSRETIPRALRELDPTRPYLPSSPYFSPAVEAGRARPPELHLWGRRDWYKTPYYLESPAVFASETGWHGCPAVPSLRRMMSPECAYPWKDGPEGSSFDWNDEWRFKASNPFLSRTSGLWKRNDLMTDQVARLFGAVSRDLGEFVAQSQFFQAEALKTMVELFRSRKFARASGLVWWNVRDGWPQLSDAAVDWYGEKKLAFGALRDAQRPVLALLAGDGAAFVVNDLLRPVRVRASFRPRGGGAPLLEGEWDVPANVSLRVGAIRLPETGVVDIEYSVDSSAPERNYYLCGEPPLDWTRVKAWFPRRASATVAPTDPTSMKTDIPQSGATGVPRSVQTVPGIVVKGHGVASGRAGDPRFPGGTVAMQLPFFKALGLDLSAYHPGTMNVDCAPLSFRPGPGALLFERVKWHPEMPAETFSFARAVLVHGGARYPAFVYWPHPETKAEHFQPGGVAEIIAAKVPGLAYGDRVTLETEPDQAVWTPLPALPRP